MLGVGPTIDAASWRSVDGGVYARGPSVGVIIVSWLYSYCFFGEGREGSLEEAMMIFVGSNAGEMTLLREH